MVGKIVFLLIILPLFALLGGCFPANFRGIDFRPMVTSLGDNAGCCGIERLTSNSYQDGSPQIALDSVGTVVVLWLSLEMRTPVIKGRLLSANGWSEEQDFGPCVGHWNIAPSPGGAGFLLARSHWGNLYARPLRGGKEKLVSTGMISSPSILSANDGAYVIWQRKISEGVSTIEGSIYRDGNWSEPIQILTTDQRIVRSFMLAGENELLLVAVLERDGSSSIWLARLSEEMRLVNPLTKLRDLSLNDPHVKGATASDGSFWLAWDEGAKGAEQIYISSSSDGEVWSEAERISLIGERNLDPAIAMDQNAVYVTWTSFDQRGGEYGWIRGRWHRIGADGWQEIEGLYQDTPILGRDTTIAAGQGRLWLAWEWEKEIYVLEL